MPRAQHAAFNLCQSKIQHLGLNGPVRPLHEEDVGRFDVAMNDALGMRCAQGLRGLFPDADDVVDRQAALRDAVAQGLAFEQLHDQVGIAVLLTDVEDRADIGMVQRGCGPCFAQKTLAHARHGRTHHAAA